MDQLDSQHAPVACSILHTGIMHFDGVHKRTFVRALLMLHSGDIHMGEFSRLDCTDVGYPLFEMTTSGMTHAWGYNPWSPVRLPPVERQLSCHRTFPSPSRYPLIPPGVWIITPLPPRRIMISTRRFPVGFEWFMYIGAA